MPQIWLFLVMKIATAPFKMTFLWSCHTYRYEVYIMSADENCLTPESCQFNSKLQCSEILSVCLPGKISCFFIKLKNSQWTHFNSTILNIIELNEVINWQKTFPVHQISYCFIVRNKNFIKINDWIWWLVNYIFFPMNVYFCQTIFIDGIHVNNKNSSERASTLCATCFLHFTMLRHSFSTSVTQQCFLKCKLLNWVSLN